MSSVEAWVEAKGRDKSAAIRGLVVGSIVAKAKHVFDASELLEFIQPPDGQSTLAVGAMCARTVARPLGRCVGFTPAPAAMHFHHMSLGCIPVPATMHFHHLLGIMRLGLPQHLALGLTPACACTWQSDAITLSSVACASPEPRNGSVCCPLSPLPRCPPSPLPTLLRMARRRMLL